MVIIESSGLPSPNPSIDLCFPSQADDKFDREFQRVFDVRTRFDEILEQRGNIINPLPTPNSEACLSSDEAGNATDQECEHEPDEYPFPTVSLCLFYPDTAPRDSWRPQIETWIRRNHSYKFVQRAAAKPYAIASKRPTQSSKQQLSAPSSNSSQSVAFTLPKAATPKQERVEASLRSPSRSVSPSPISKPGSPSMQANHNCRRCISCGSDQSPCWRPSWSIEAGQLCNSCGLRYKKTGARCLSASCGRIPAKGEWVTMRSTQAPGRYTCLYCGGGVAVGENSKR
ncbi:hypothetical protein POJ06DRAFT_77157 [Lipomyces tetrasporus]|uniref:GATA-type domain-containing protein n=1 Tax=Lipomyces tetrasporus TaxID=54092 RepID=A0AAD7VUK4_9ASCO|nr:uncharacterized protein POJ06DRAFT_77157 [Lipomyces tetrasporus]KAJ8102116.1 hypothetical protein POJ06DRAFT_77157 [Lipomyces tetrasporus]